MVIQITLCKRRYVSSAALRAGIVLPRAVRPLARVLDVDLSRGMDVSEEFTWQDRNRVFHVVNMRNGYRLGIDVVRKVLVADSGKAVSDVGHGEPRDVEREVDSVQKRDRGTWEVG